MNPILDNALEAWATSIHYSLQIKSGMATLQNKKLFVTSLHNATELFIKSKMIENNDYRLLIPLNIGADGQPAKEYYNAQSIKDFINTKKSKTQSFSKKFHSCKYNNLIQWINTIFSHYFDINNSELPTVKMGLKLL